MRTKTPRLSTAIGGVVALLALAGCGEDAPKGYDGAWQFSVDKTLAAWLAAPQFQGAPRGQIEQSVIAMQSVLSGIEIKDNRYRINVGNIAHACEIRDNSNLCDGQVIGTVQISDGTLIITRDSMSLHFVR